jgi:predicted NBD/HSP70 family sugar kinase
MRAVPSSLRLLNQRRVLEELLLAGPASRADIATRAGMSRPTAGKIIDDLLEAGAVEEREEDGPAPPGRLGRPGRLVGLESRTPRLLLVELGVRRTTLHAVALALDGSDAFARSEAFPTPRSAEGFLRKLDEARAALRAPRPWAFAISIPGVYDERAERSLLSPNLHWVAGASLVKEVERRWRLPGCGVQEIRALALGQARHAPGDFLLVDAGDGVGAAAVLAGRLYEGPLALSGEIGHTPVVGNDRPCGCGGRGCLETLVARPGLLASHAAHATGATAADWPELVAALRAGARPGWLEDSLQALASVVGGALNVLGLGRVALTGLFEELPPAEVRLLHDRIGAACLAGRLGQIEVTVAPRRRAEGLVRRLFDRLLIPTEDWSRPGVVEGA